LLVEMQLRWEHQMITGNGRAHENFQKGELELLNRSEPSARQKASCIFALSRQPECG
jgi:hypothetical protein